MLRRATLALAALLLWCAAAHANVTRQIGDAPGWLPSTSYTGAANLTSSRVLAGPGYAASGSAFTNGSAVYLWIATVSGTSASSGNGPQSCPTPGTSTVTDGGVTWKCLTAVDYNSITGFLNDDPLWITGTVYTFNGYVTSDSASGLLKDYRLVQSEITGCTAGSTAPHGTGSSISDGGCTWLYVASIPYTSLAGGIPRKDYPSSGTPKIGMMTNYIGNIWYGGLAQPQYVPGSNNETNPIIAFAHQDLTTDDSGDESELLCPDGVTNTWPDCGTFGNTQYPSITLQAASADSFMNYPSAATTALYFNDTTGVAIHATAAQSSTGPFSQPWDGGNAISTIDSGVMVTGIQVKSDHAIAFDAQPHGDVITLQNDILDGTDYAPHTYVFWADGSSTLLNNLLIYRGSTSGGAGMIFKYPGMAVNNTIVNLGSAANSICTVQEFGGTAGALAVPLIYDNYCAGFTYGSAEGNGAYSTLGAAITSTTATSITTATNCCSDSFSDTTARVIVDQEIMTITAGYNTTSLTVTRGTYGTTAATHLNGAPIVAIINRGTSANNASDLSAMTAPVGGISSNGLTFGVSDFPGVGSTCGAGNTSPCFGQVPASQFVNDATDFRLLSTAGIRGAGSAVSATQQNWLVALTNLHDIIGQARPNGSSYDLGAWEFYPTTASIGAGGRLRRFP